MNEIKNLIDSYNELESIHKQKVAKAKASMERAQKRYDKLLRTYPTRNRDLLIPLANAIKNRFGFKCYEIYGPFGLSNETSLYFANEGRDGNISITEVETWSLTFHWDYKDNGAVVPLVWTGETKDDFRPGSIGYLNGMNKVCVSIPNNIHDLGPLFRHSPSRQKREAE